MVSKCGFCKGVRFELTEVSPNSSRVKMYFIQCCVCGAPVGVTSYYDTNSALENTNQKIKELGNKIDSVEFKLNQVVVALNKRH